MLRTMLPTPAPGFPSTTRQIQCGAASAAMHAPLLSAAQDEHGSAVPAPDQKGLALQPSSILLTSLLHPRFPSDHAQAAAPPSPPAAVLPADLPQPPQTHCAILHAAPRSHPDSA